MDPMLLAMNWGAALLMALGLGIVYGHATRDTGTPLLDCINANNAHNSVVLTQRKILLCILHSHTDVSCM